MTVASTTYSPDDGGVPILKCSCGSKVPVHGMSPSEIAYLEAEHHACMRRAAVKHALMGVFNPLTIEDATVLCYALAGYYLPKDDSEPEPGSHAHRGMAIVARIEDALNAGS